MQDSYFQLLVRPASHHDLFRDFLSDTLPIGFEERDDAFIVRSEDELDTIEWGVEQFREALQKALGVSIDLEMEQSRHRNDDWVKIYQQSVTAVEVAPFYIHPTWAEAKPGMLNIAIDPALAFGTGHHPTTASCLQAVARCVHAGDEVLDVGCGSGILGIAAAKLGAQTDACDTDAVSVENSIVNAEQNGVAWGKIWEGSATAATKTYDVVIANIVADVLVMISGELKRVVKAGGTLILSGILDKYEAKVSDAYADCEPVERIAQDEWVTLILKRKAENEQ